VHVDVAAVGGQRVRGRGRMATLGPGMAATISIVGLVAQGAGACSQAGYTRGVNLTAGVTKVALASALTSRFNQEGITVTTGGPAGAPSGGLTLPVTGGLVWSESGWGSVDPGGQLVFVDRTDNRRARFTDVRLSFLPTPELTATAPTGAGVELFNVHLSEQPATGITFSAGPGTHRAITYRNIGLDVSTTGAAAIDDSLRTAAVKSGEWVGQASLHGRGQLVN
jgi:hypothetical protein